MKESTLPKYLKSFIYKRGTATLDQVLQAGREFRNSRVKVQPKDATIERALRRACSEIAEDATQWIRPMYRGQGSNAPLIGYETVKLYPNL